MITLPRDGTKSYARYRRKYVYFAQRETDKLIKIGCSEKPATRLKLLAKEFLSTMTCLGLIPGSYDLEIKLHKTFADSRVVGEWFKPSQQLLDFISQSAHPVEFEPPRKPAQKRGAGAEKYPFIKVYGNQAELQER